MITLQVHRSYVKARTPSGPSTTQRENDVTSALTESGHERLRLPMELLSLPGRAHQWTGLQKGTIVHVREAAHRF